MQRSFTFESKAQPIRATKTAAAALGVWTDGVVLQTEESLTERLGGFIPAYRLRKGKTYRVSITSID